MFAGSYALSVDDKGRVAVPAPFRQLLSRDDCSTLYVTPMQHDDKPHLEVYPEPEFRGIAEQIKALADSEMAELLKQALIGSSHRVELDSQGRVLLPQTLREDVGIGSKVVIEGQISRFDIWDEARYKARRADPERLKQALSLIKR